MSRTPSIAIVHDRLNVRGGGEMFLEELAQLYPEAPIYTLIYDPKVFANSPISKHRIRSSFINRLPLAASQHRFYIPLMPWAIERFDLREYDILLSSSAAFAHGVHSHAKQLHFSYIHSPMRYAWHQYRQHVSELGFGSLPIRALLASLRRWDRVAAQRPSHLLANSKWTAQCVREAFGRDSTVIYPPVHIEKFSPAENREDYFLTVSRLVPYKRVDLIVEAFSALGLPLIVAGDGPDSKRLRSGSAANIQFLDNQSDGQIATLMSRAKAFVYAAEEDFGIAPVEAQAAGCPVIAFGHGGLLETVINGKTGIFFDQQTVESLVTAVKEFERGRYEFEQKIVRANAERFNATIFRNAFTDFVSTQWELFSAN